MNEQAEVRWARDERVVFHGRNGTGLCCGLWLTTVGDKVIVRPITSQGKLANCHIDVPVAFVPQVIAALKKCMSRGPMRRHVEPECAQGEKP